MSTIIPALFVITVSIYLSRLVYVAYFKYKNDELLYPHRKLINDRLH